VDKQDYHIDLKMSILLHLNNLHINYVFEYLLQLLFLQYILMRNLLFLTNLQNEDLLDNKIKRVLLKGNNHVFAMFYPNAIAIATAVPAGST
jgi:hypothetical protein